MASTVNLSELDLAELFAILHTCDQGLTSQEANQRLRIRDGDRQRTSPRRYTPGDRRLHGAFNPTRHHPPRPAWHEISRQFASPIIWVLAGTTLLSMLLGDIVEGAVILLVLLASGAAGYWREHQVSRAMAQLLARVQVQVEVLRDAQVISVPLTEVVPGDVVVLNAGDVIPADLRLIAAHNLLIDESVLTGESEPEERAVGPRSGWLREGTHVVSGTGRAVAVLTGTSSEYGRLTERVRRGDRPSAFEAGTTRLGLLLVRTMIVLVAVLIIINLLLERPLVESLLFALAVAVGLTPQLLPAIVVASMSSGAQRMAKESVLVKQLDAIADFGGMTVLCCDKTGTLTEGSLALDRAVDCSGQSSDRVLWLATVNATLQTGMSNPLDAALSAAAPGSGTQIPELIDEIPYDFERRRLSVLVKSFQEQVPLLITKGAYAEVLDACTQIRIDAAIEPLDTHRTAVDELFACLSRDGFRVLAVATKSCATQDAVEDTDEALMILEGLLAFRDPLKPDASEALNRLKTLGIRVVLITGDNAEAARYVANATDLPTVRVALGADVEQMDETELCQTVVSCQVFAQVDPLEKERIVQALQANGAVVGLLGDGINDSAALRAANVGISVNTAVDVAREAASLVLLEKDLHVIADGVREGRRTFANTLKYVRVTMSANLGNMFSLVIASAFLPFLPLLPLQILLLNFLSDIPAFALSDDRVDQEALAAPTVWNVRGLQAFMVIFGLVSSAFDLALFFVLSRLLEVQAGTFQAAWFAASTLTELAALLVLRTARPFWRSKASWTLLAAICGVALFVLLLVITPLGALLELTVLPLALVGLVLLSTFGYVLVNEAVKRAWPSALSQA